MNAFETNLTGLAMTDRKTSQIKIAVVIPSYKVKAHILSVVDAVSYTHPPSPRDLSTSRMPSSA